VMNFFSDLGKLIANRNANRSGNNNANVGANVDANVGANVDANVGANVGAISLEDPYEKDLKLYRDKIAELKGNRGKINQQISEFETARTGQDFNYRNQIDEVGGQKKKLNENLTKSLDKLKQKQGNIHGVYQHKKTTLEDINKYQGYQKDYLERQLGTFMDIESNVSTRDRIVQINQEAYKKKNFRVHALIMFFVLVMLLIFPIVGFMSNMVSGSTLSMIMMAVISLYLIYIIWSLNILSVKKFGKAVVHDFDILAQDIKNGVYIIRGDISNKVFGKTHQVPCPECPSKGGDGGEDIRNITHHDAGEGGIIHNENSFWYYDGTSPPERIIPPTKNGEKGIVWNAGPDMGSRDNGRYTPDPKWTMKANSCLPGWQKKADSALPKPALSNTDRGACLPWDFNS